MSAYSETLIDSICETLSTTHKSIRKCCEENGVSYNAFKAWINDQKPDFKEYALAQYTRAKDEQIAYLADEILNLTYEMQELIKQGKTYGDNVNAAVSALRIQIDSIKWILSKLVPKKYGDKIDLTSDGEPIGTGIKDETLLALAAKING